MSAVIQNEYTGNNSTTTYSFTFPYLKTSDIKASLDGVDTTAFTLPNATTLQFNTAPGSGVKIKIFRQTSVDTLTATFYAGSAIKSEDLNDNFTQNLYKTQEVGARFISNLGGTMTGDLNMGEDTVIKFEGATDDAHETTITVADPTADRTITFPNVTGNVVTTGDTGTVATGMIAADAVTGAKIADDQINSEHYVDGSIDTQHIADAQVTTAKIADSNVTTGKLAADAVTAAKLADNAVVTANIVDANVTTAKIAADAVNGTKIADNSIDSEHYVDGSIDNAHLANNSVTLAKMADDSVGTAELVDGSVDTARLADNSVTLAKMTDNSVGTSEVVDAAVTTAKIADNAVTMAKLASGTLPTDITVASANLVDGTVATADIADNAITSGKIAAGAVDSTDIGSGVIDTVHIGSSQVTTAKIADSNITTAKITDANVTTDKIANDAITIGKLGCEQTTISDSDSHIPTSGAVVDYVAAQIAPLGGLEVIATEVAFPNTQPSSGVVISISDAAGIVVSGTSSNTGRTVGGSTVTINNFPSSLTGETLATGVGLMVSSTGSGQVYNYHKILAAETDVKQLSDDINDFNARYRVGSSNPTSALDAGDLFFNTSTQKLLVYNSTNSAWEEAQSIGNFFISTFSEAFDGSRTQFTLSNAPTNVQQVLLSLNGVVQKPGTAFTLSGSTVTLASAPASGTDYFAVVMGSTVNIGTPSNNTVSTAVLQDDSVTTAKIAASNVTATELGANAVITSKIADNAVTAAKIADGAIVNADVNASAAIAGTKISPNFGSQDITASDLILTGTGTSSSNSLDLTYNASSGVASINADSNGGNTALQFGTSSSGTLNTNRLGIATDGTVSVAGNLDVGAGLDVTGNITVSGTVDGVDIANTLVKGNGSNNGTTEINVADADFIVEDTTDGTTNFIWRDHSDSKLYLGTSAAVVTPRSNVIPQADSTFNLGTSSVRWANVYADTLYGDGSNLSGINTDLVSDTSPQLGGDLDFNGNNALLQGPGGNSSTNWDNDAWEKILFDNSYNANPIGPNKVVLQDDTNWKAGFGISSNELGMYSGANITLYGKTTDSNASTKETLAKFISDGAVELYYNNTKRFETTSYGTRVTGYQSSSSYVGFHVKGTNSDHGYGTNHGSGITTYDVSYYSPIPMFSSKTIDHGSSYLSFPSYAGGNYVKFTAPVSGLYQLELIASVETHHGGDWMQMGWEINTETANSTSDFMNNSRGVLAVNERAGQDAETGCHFSTTIYMAANDYAVLFQQSTQAVRWRGNQYYVRGHLIH